MPPSPLRALQVGSKKTPGLPDFNFITRPVPTLPGSGARLVHGRVYFEWEESIDPYGWPLRYGLKIHRGDTLILELSTDVTAFTLSDEEALLPGRYVWQVWAYNAGGSSGVAETPFTVADGPLPALKVSAAGPPPLAAKQTSGRSWCRSSAGARGCWPR